VVVEVEVTIVVMVTNCVFVVVINCVVEVVKYAVLVVVTGAGESPVAVEVTVEVAEEAECPT